MLIGICFIFIEIIMRLLLINPGRRDYIIKYFLKLEKKFNLKIFLIDCDEYIPSFKVSKKTCNFISPKTENKELFKIYLKNFIKKNKINVIFPLSDRELEILAEEKKFYKEKKIDIIISDLEFIKFTQNKILMAKFLKKNNFFSPEIIKYSKISKKLPVIKKKILGSGSVLQFIIKKKWQIPHIDEKNYFYSKYLPFEEYGIDILNDLNGNYVHSCCRKKILMRSGDTDRAKIINSKAFEIFAKKLSLITKHVGIIDVDFIYKKKKIFILDINARIGGGYPFTHEFGFNYFEKILSMTINSKKKISFKINQKKKYNVFTKGISVYKH